MKYLRPDGTFDVEGFRHTTRVFITAMDILVDYASYRPNRFSLGNSHVYRTLGDRLRECRKSLDGERIPYDSPPSA